MTVPKRAELGLGPVIGATVPLSVPRLIQACARAAPEAPALLAPGRLPLTYRRLSEQMAGVASSLGALGIGRGDPVAVVLPNGPEMAAVFLGIAAGAVCAPLNPAYRRAEFDFYLSDLDARALVIASEIDSPAREAAHRKGVPVAELSPLTGGEAGLFALAGEEPRRAAPDGFAEPQDVALVLHTSGTTARPKIVPLRHANLCASARNVAASLELAGDDRCLNIMPLFHIHGLVGALLASLLAGRSVICSPGLTFPAFFSWLDELEPTWYTAVPTMHQAILARAGDNNREVLERHRLRLIRSSSSALPPRVHERLEREFGVPVIDAYGMTEAAHQMASNPLPPRRRKKGSVGLPAGPEIAVLDEAGRRLPAGKEGEVAIRGANVFGGYERNPEANERAFTRGWFRTGDEGFLDGDGYLFLRGRIKEIINRGGEKISPFEVEGVLLDHPAVAQAVTFAVPHALLGEEIAAALVLREGTSVAEREIQEFAAARLADFKVPRRVLVLDELPKGPTGKVQRIGLAERLALTEPEGEGGEKKLSYAEPRTDLERSLAAIVAGVLGLDRVGLRDDFFALGGDSLRAAEWLARVREAGHAAVELPLATLLWAPTVEKLAALLESGGWSESSSLVPIQPLGGKAPLFFVHPHGGDVMLYGTLARCLGEDRPFYGVRARGLEDGEEGGREPVSRVEDMAASYLAEIRALQPEGPYFLGGHCLGGAVAYEMARRLAEGGQEVAALALVNPAGEPRGRLRHYRRRLIFHVRKRRLTRVVLKKLAGRLARAAGQADPSGPARARLSRAMTRARDGYVPSRYPGRIILFHGEDYLTPFSFWQERVGGVESHAIPGTGDAVLLGENARAVAERLRAAFRGAEAAEEG